MVAIKAKTLGNFLGNGLPVPGEHDAAVNLHPMEGVNGIPSLILDPIGNGQASQEASLPSHIDHGRGSGVRGVGNLQVFHELGVSSKARFAIIDDRDAGPRIVSALLDSRGANLAPVGFLDGQGNGVIRECLGKGGGLKEVLGGNPEGGVYGHHVKRSCGQGAGLIEYHGVHLREGLQVIAAFHQHAGSGCASDAAEKGQGHRYY